MDKYIDGEELYDFQIEVTGKDHDVWQAAEDIVHILQSSNDTSDNKKIMSSVSEIIKMSMNIMTRHGIKMCVPHYDVENGNYLPCYNMDTRCRHCTKNKG